MSRPPSTYRAARRYVAKVEKAPMELAPAAYRKPGIKPRHDGYIGHVLSRRTYPAGNVCGSRRRALGRAAGCRSIADTATREAGR